MKSDGNKEGSASLLMLQKDAYVSLPETDPLIYYYLPFFGPLYRRRVELALNLCRGGANVLEVGYGSGVAFLNLAQKYKEIHGIDLFADADAVTAMWKDHGISADLKKGDLLSLPYKDGLFDTVLLISILEHIKPRELDVAMGEVHRVLKPSGQLVYGVPVERPLLVLAYKVLGYDIREHHFSTQENVANAARARFTEKEIHSINYPFFGNIYQVGNFIKV
jgi:ubiquinone/menaquinone biosynthesis C-methylase UbiE